MQQLVRNLVQHHEPMQRWEFRCFAAVGLALALAAVLLCSMIRLVDTRQAAQVTGSSFAVVSSAAPAHG